MKPDQFKVLKIVGNKMEGDLQTNYLISQGIEAHLRGSREYASIITGHDFGRFEILVKKENLDLAKKLLSELQRDSIDESIQAPLQLPAESKIKRAIIYAIISSLTLPLLFNFVSVYYTGSYLTDSSYSGKSVLISLGLIALNIAAILFWYMLYFGVKS